MPSPNQDIFARSGREIIADIRALLTSSSANATGKTSKSLESIAGDDRLLVLGGGSFGLNSREVGFVAGGRGAGKLPPFMPIAEWAVARGIISDPQRESKAVQGIRFAIARKGTVLFRNNTTRDIYQSVITDERVNDILDQISGVYAQDILSKVVKTFE